MDLAWQQSACGKVRLQVVFPSMPPYGILSAPQNTSARPLNAFIASILVCRACRMQVRIKSEALAAPLGRKVQRVAFAAAFSMNRTPDSMARCLLPTACSHIFLFSLSLCVLMQPNSQGSAGGRAADGGHGIAATDC